MKPRVKAGKVTPMSVEAAEAKELQRSMSGNQIPERPPGETIKPVQEEGQAEPKNKKAKPVQMEAVALIPKLDSVGKAGKRMAKAVKELETAQDEKGEAEQALINAMVKADRKSFQTMGFKFSLKHTGPKDSIAVQKPK